MKGMIKYFPEIRQKLIAGNLFRKQLLCAWHGVLLRPWLYRTNLSINHPFSIATMHRIIKTALLAFIIFLIQDASLAQSTSAEIDSLQHSFLTEPSDMLRMDAARSLALYYNEISPDTARYFADTQLQLARSLGEPLWEGHALWLNSFNLLLLGKYSEAFTLNTQAITLLTDPSTEQNVWELSRLSTAATPKLARLTALALAYHNLGHLYGRIGNIPEQRAHQQKAIEIVENFTSFSAVSPLAYASLGYTYIEDYPDSALYYIGIALEKGEPLSSWRYRGLHLNFMGQAYEALTDFDSAENYYLEAIAESRRQNNNRSLATAHYNLARLNEISGDTGLALENALNSYAVAETGQFLSMIQMASSLLSTLYEQLNDTDKAYYYLKQSQAASETLQNEEQVRRASDLQFADQLRLRDLEEARERSQARIRMIVLLGVLFTIVLAAFLLYRNYRQQQGANTVLQKTLDDLKKTQDQLIQQEKLASLGQLTAGIAHEIKNPLNFVNNFSEVSLELVEEMRHEVTRGTEDRSERRETEDRGPGNSPLSRGESEGGAEARGVSSEAEEGDRPQMDLILEILNNIGANLKKINEHGTRADNIVQSMLQHSRGGDGKMEPTPLNPIVKEYVNLAFHGMRAGQEPVDVDIQMDFDESIGEVPLIAEDFSRVILNLCNNGFDACAEKLTEDGGPETGYVPKLTVRTRSENGSVIIEIEDNGPGIPDDIKDKILQPFFTTKKGTQGTGLGLSITNDIIKAHGGQIDIDSKPGSTRFRILLQG